MKAAIMIAANDPSTIKSATAAILGIIKSTGNADIAIAGLNTLQALAKCPQNTTIQNCHIQNHEARRK